MQLIPLEKITVRKDRQRRTFDPAAMQELEDSIGDTGLMHPVVIREVADGFELIAGERRLRAFQGIWSLDGSFNFDGQTVPKGQVPCVTLGELSELDAEEAQLDENLRRVNLSWQEETATLDRLARLRARQASQSGTPAPTLQSLAEEAFRAKRGDFGSGATAYGKDQVRKELVVAKFLDRPTVKAAKTLDEAFKIVKREEELSKSNALGASVGKTFSSKDHSLLNGSCLEVAAQLEGGFDVLLTDPPYGMGADEFGDSGGRNLQGESIHMYTDDDTIINEVVLPALTAYSNLCKPAAHAYVFCDIDRFHQLRALFTSLGWSPFRTPLIWAKPDGRVPLPEHGPRRTYELLLYAFRGKRPTRKVGSDILSFPPDVNLNLAAQKPVALFQELLSRSCLPGDQAVDPFGGTGTLLPAAHALKVRATVIEKNPTTYGIAVKRLQDLDSQKEIDL